MTEFRTNGLFYWFAIHRAYRLESAGFAVLEEGFPSMEAAWKGTASELSAAGLDGSSVSGLLKIQGATTPEAEIERFAENGVEAILRPDSRYPARLREIPDAPPVLYLKGSWEPKDDWRLPAVGGGAPPPTAGRRQRTRGYHRPAPRHSHLRTGEGNRHHRAPLLTRSRRTHRRGPRERPGRGLSAREPRSRGPHRRARRTDFGLPAGHEAARQLLPPPQPHHLRSVARDEHCRRRLH